MFIVCPSCSGPFRIHADQIAPLVQVACPHCEYRVILDFEAANEPSLREPGHQFAQGYETAQAYFSVYDHVTSKPDAQPGHGLVDAPRPSETPAHVPAHTPAPTAKPAQAATPPRPEPPVSAPPPEPKPEPKAEPAATSFSRGSKTIVQVPSKKPTAIDPGAAPTPSAAEAAAAKDGSSMRAGRGTEQIHETPAEKVEPRVEAPSEPSERRPPHTPPTANVVSSGPVAEAPSTPTTRPEDIAAQSGSRPVEKPVDKPAEIKPAEKPADKPADKPVQPAETSSSGMIYAIIVAIIIAAVVAVVMINRGP
jgi:DNA-directed RNA polymerase subunit RPC12/RpoP